MSILDNKTTLEFLNKIQASSAFGYKKEVLKQLYLKNKKIVKKFLNLTYSPYNVFNIKNIKDYSKLELDDRFRLHIVDTLTLLNEIENAFIIQKLTGKNGKEALKNIYFSCDASGKELLIKILNRDLDSGINTSTINKIIPNCIPVANYMGAVSFSGFDDIIKRIETIVSSFYGDVDPEYIIGMSQKKMDGLFAFLELKDKKIISRKLKEILFLNPDLRKQIVKLHNTVTKTSSFRKTDNITLHGELTIDGEEDRLAANGIFKALTTIQLKNLGLTKKEMRPYHDEFLKVFGCSVKDMQNRVRYTVWDITSDAIKRHSNLSRFLTIEKIINDADIPFIKLVENKMIYKKDGFEKLINHFEEVLKQDEEGIIFKLAGAQFENGHSVNCKKFKNIFEGSLEIIGFEKGSKKDTLGALICQSSDGKIQTQLSGIKDDLKKEIWENQEKYLGKIVDFLANDITKSSKNEHSSLMHPRFVEIRDDKTVADDYDKIELSRNSFDIVKQLLENIKQTEGK